MLGPPALRNVFQNHATQQTGEKNKRGDANALHEVSSTHILRPCERGGGKEESPCSHTLR
jgi:hypothetical protein